MKIFQVLVVRYARRLDNSIYCQVQRGVSTKYIQTVLIGSNPCPIMKDYETPIAQHSVFIQSIICFIHKRKSDK